MQSATNSSPELPLSSEGGWERVIRPRQGIASLDVKELWYYRELLVFLIWRNILIRYKQTAIGIAWAVAQPLLTMLVLTFVFKNLAGMESADAPYAIMTLAAILPWTLFANALTAGSNSVVAAGHMVRKIYFPRLFIPAADGLSGLLDFLLSLILLFLMMGIFLVLGENIAFRWHLLLLPVFTLVALLAALGVSFWFSALNVKYRDVKYVIPFITRMGIYISPVGFMSAVVPEQWRFAYSLNPMVGVIDGFRWAILGSNFEPYWPGFWASIGVVVVIFVGGLFFYRATEKTFADVI